MNTGERHADVIGLLRAASLLAPESTATGNDFTPDDIWDDLVHDRWETVLGLLEECAGSPDLPAAFWEGLARAAEQSWLPRSAAWCHWRAAEARNGSVRAELRLRPAGEARRRTPLAGQGVLRPMWDIGNRAPDGAPAWNIAGLWVEGLPFLAPGGRAVVRLVPLTPAQWAHVAPGARILMHEDASVAGEAVVLEVRAPAGREPRR
ncbi:hypothetical protein [Streptomyces sp. NPDC048590]|uniref:hypothetical protein n=1 Tax=Streptomyces sp. NPDC048590 TaxID=3365574 RepID=UPI003713CB21